MPPLDTTASYSTGDYALVVVPTGIIVMPYRASADTLTLSFREHDYALIALDAYTNKDRWSRALLTCPSVSTNCLLAANDVFDENGIASSGSAPVEYAWCAETAILRISIGDAAVSTYVRCLGNVICGLDETGRPAELWIDQLTVVGMRAT